MTSCLRPVPAIACRISALRAEKPPESSTAVCFRSATRQRLEGVAYSLTWRPDETLERLADQAIDDIVSAQRPDGYLNTYYILNGMENRWTNLMDNHELYCAGHMLEAAVAYYQATGKRKLLDAMIRYVDCIDSAIGPEEGKRHGTRGIRKSNWR